MKPYLVVLCIVLSVRGNAHAIAGGVLIPSDLSIALTATPSIDLHSGQRIDFTVSVTNHGPEPVYSFGVHSSPIYDELDVFTASSSECQGDIVLAVVDLEDSFYFLFNYYVVDPDTPPLKVGETRSCKLSLEYTPWAPATFAIGFDMASAKDLDPSNNSAQVVLRRAVAAQSVPSLSTMGLGVLIALLLGAAWRLGRPSP